MRLLVVSFNHNPFALTLARFFNVPHLTLPCHRFADKEVYFPLSLLSPVKEHHILFVGWFNNARHSDYLSINDQLFTHCLLIQALKRAGALSVTVFYPYLPYARQHRKDGDEGGVSLIEELYQSIGVASLITCDMHHQPVTSLVPIHSLSIAPFWKETMVKHIAEELSDAVCVAPDNGAFLRATQFARLVNIEVVSMHKKRIAVDEPVIYACQGAVKDKNVFIVDDIIATGKTALRAAEIVHQRGARHIYGLFTHGIFADQSWHSLEKSYYTKIFVTNTLAQDNDFDGNNRIIRMAIDEYIAHKVYEVLTIQLDNYGL